MQFTVVNGATSKMKNITCGVPHGSVLGPVLFLLYINDLHRVLEDENTRLFADDTSLYDYNRDIKQLVSAAKAKIKKLYCWCVCNKLTINASKTNFILFHTRNKAAYPELTEISTDVMTIKRVKCTKYLGLFIDENLNWHQHVDFLCKDLVKYFGIFNNVKYFVTQRMARQLYFAFIFSRINYGISVYGTCSPTYINKLQIIQNKLIILLLKLGFRTSTDYIHKRLSI